MERDRRRRCYLVSFHPLASTTQGRHASKSHGLPPYIDGSCRREPNLESEFPSITALCRAGKFAPHLQRGDLIFYMSVKQRHLSGSIGWALVAALEVVQNLRTHKLGKMWFQRMGLPIPSNCMVTENPPVPLHKTIGLPKGKDGRARLWGSGTWIRAATLSDWDKGYWQRARQFSSFVVTRYLEEPRLYNPRIATNEELVSIFGKLPGTQSKKIITESQFEKLLEMLQSTPIQ